MGPNDYRQFLVVGVIPRPRFWQERKVSSFLTAHPELGSSLEEVISALRVCEVHGDELVEGAVAGIRGEIDFAPPTTEERMQYPRAHSSPVGLGASPERPVPVWYCPSCRVMQSEWRRRQALG